MKDLLGDKPPAWQRPGGLSDLGDPVARRSDPDTSHKAAERMKPIAGTDREKVLLEHYKHPHGLTDYELAALLDRQQNSVGKRRSELRDAGLVEPTDLRRPAPSGSLALVWRISSAGIGVAREIIRDDR